MSLSTPMQEAPSLASSLSVSENSHRKTPATLTLHLIGNAHLDPVWLWDWREGMNEGIATCRAMCSMLREFPEFRFIRGEAAVYKYIHRHAPALFDEICEYIAAGRWDIVGGNWIQPDTNLPCTEAILRQFLRGKEYFRETFGVEVTAAWAADSFGHSAGLPEILSAAGMDSFAFTRPQANILPLPSQAFWWKSRSGARVLAYRPHDGWYASERVGISERLDSCVARAKEEGASTAALFYGLGNHGGGPSRLHLKEIQEWITRHPEIKVEHSGLHRFFSDLRDGLAFRGEDSIPTHEGELNFCLRGCSASVARFKYAYRQAEASLLRAERTATFCQAARISDLTTDINAISKAWDTLLFNAFHDILPGTAIERAYRDQLAQLGSVYTSAQYSETAALTDLASRIDTNAGAWPVPAEHPLPQPVIVWNPHPWTLRTVAEVEVSLDHRPLWHYQDKIGEMPVRIVEAMSGKNLPFQIISEEHDSFRHIPWRCRAAVRVEVPPMGWTLIQMGIDPSAEPSRAITTEDPEFRCIAVNGASAVQFTRDGVSWLSPGLQVRLYEDQWGAWGGMQEELDSWLLNNEIERLIISETELLENGPLRFATWVRFSGDKGRSSVEITFYIERGNPRIRMEVRAFLGDRGVRMKLIIPAAGVGGVAEYEVPGGSTFRDACGEVSGGRWVKAGSPDQTIGFASDSLYGFETTETELRATIARTSRYACDVKYAPAERPWQPCADLGEHTFRALLTTDTEALPRMANELQEPPTLLPVPAHTPSNPLPAQGALLGDMDSALSVLACTTDDGGNAVLRIQNISKVKLANASLRWNGHSIVLGEMLPGKIQTLSLLKK